MLFSCLSQLETEREYEDFQLLKLVENAYYQPTDLYESYSEQVLSWLKQYQSRLNESDQLSFSRVEKMNQANPKFVLINYLVQVAIDKADDSEIEKLLRIFSQPYAEQPEFEEYANKRPEWARDKGWVFDVVM